ncbi:MAG: PTS glucose transporter subunit IIA [Erysipelotrichaceae bacterium]|nr:PTS glucose transporter subunit IIA [Erysipelotrichaceae bacterium]
MTGKIISIEDVPDKVFASKAMGDGFAVELTGKTVISPVSGEVMMAYPTKHAFGIRTHDNKEILLHIGMDTVELGGKGFESTLRAGDMITQGDPIVEVDLEYVKSQGKSLISPVILTSGDKVKLLKVNQDVKIGEKDIIEFE